MVTLSRATNLLPSEGDHMTDHMIRLLENKSDTDNIKLLCTIVMKFYIISDAPIIICSC